MSAKTLRRNKCDHEIVEVGTMQGHIFRRYCQMCGATFPIPQDKLPRSGQLIEPDVDPEVAALYELDRP